MALLKFTLQLRPKDDGSQSIRLRVTKDRVARYLPTEHTIKNAAKFWDDDKGCVNRNYENHNTINNKLKQFELQTENKIMEIEKKNPHITCQEIIAHLTDKVSFNVLGMASNYVKSFDPIKEETNFLTFQSRYNVLKKYIGLRSVVVSQITTEWLKAYKKWMEQSIHVGGSKPYSKKTISNNLAFLRTIVKQAVNSGVIQYHENPFLTFPISKEEGNKIPLFPEEIERIRDVKISEDDFYLFHGRNLFLFMYNNMGMRIGDALRLTWSQILDGKFFRYDMHKSDDPMMIKLTDESRAILSYYKKRATIFNNKGGRVFPNIDFACPHVVNPSETKRVKTATKNLNKAMKRLAAKVGIKKNLSTHVARHSWVQAALENDVSMYTIGVALGHSTEVTTRNYTKRGFHLPKLNEINKLVTARQAS